MWNILNRSHTNVHTIAYILGTVSILGYAVSFLRDRVFAHQFGAGEVLDVYIASFRIPDILFITATACISIYALLPIFEEKKRLGEQELREFINTTFYFLLLFLAVGTVALFFAIPVIAEHFFQGFSGESRETFILFSRMFLIQASLFAVSSFFTALLQMKRKFLLYSLLPILYNIGIIVGVLLLYPTYGAVGLAFGVLFGVLLSVGIQIPIILRNGGIPIPAPTRRMAAETWRAVKMSLPRASALLSVVIADIIIFSVFVSLSGGVLSIYYFADNLRAMPLVIVGVAYSVAAFPVLVSHYTQGAMDKFRDVIEHSFRRLFFFILPLIAYVFILREPLIALFFETGLFTAETTVITGTIVGILVFSALTTSVLALCARALYACGKSLIPFLLFVSLSVAKVITVIAVVQFLEDNREPLLAVLSFTGLESGGFGKLFAVIVAMFALEAVAALLAFGILYRIIRQQFRGAALALVQHAVATGALIITILTLKEVVFDTVRYNSIEGALAIACMTALGALAWYGVLRWIGNKESDIVHSQVRRISAMLFRR